MARPVGSTGHVLNDRNTSAMCTSSIVKKFGAQGKGRADGHFGVRAIDRVSPA